ncbi:MULTISPECIES: pilus assembly protein [unclassified Pseudoalteromonas]|uniref:pilus assembly protein n=1 Tax=unclassified Pseudoalteromonas TaxID=194690 RepID=UPI00110B6E5B|nr:MULTISPECIES: PilC/PilY family type IV pilus protein [unclassified Pseudoalteromonas]MDC9497619.1 PilC/PilY family type IV pilus protein [Pseudoalteromonas sp. Angola-20]MDC9516835.1 PilC/PilY family type IV pilus protein [Pseudoalteromonas sp. Angola-22]MDC9533243.1 PilC/PilY family type IV pilus protein [Pseudoalteromonas sp. Angola-9]TMP78784.1 pilin biogenesis protein [Pseudoalteromonas sp. S983]
MKLTFNRIVASFFAATVSLSVTAEDIELYVNHNVETDEKPRVLIVFDTSGSMGSKLPYNGPRKIDAAKDAMTDLVNNNESIDFGLMRFQNNYGGYVMAEIGSSRATVKNQIKSLPASGSTPVTETLWEAYLYLTGQQVLYGYEEYSGDEDFLSKTVTYKKNKKNKKVTTLTYISPFETDLDSDERCDNSINLILMTDGDPQSDTESNYDIYHLYKSKFGSYPSTTSGSYLAALAQIIHGTSDVEIDLYDSTPEIADTGRVFTIGFGSGMSPNGKKLLEQTAQVGGGEYLHANTSAELSEKLNSTISRIREVNDSFSSPTVASNNVDQTRSREAIYFAMFYPETGARWGGNLKKLVMSGSNIVDSTGREAIGDDGLIKEDARTFWLPSNKPADGNLVAQGGVNYLLSSLDSQSRKLYIDSDGSIVDFTFDRVKEILNIVSDAIGGIIPGTDIAISRNDINWARGMDVDNEDSDSSSVDQRANIFGDPLHSKPVSIDYGDGNIRILVGTNAGFLHMFNDKGNSIEEEWAFMPAELLKNIPALRTNQANTKVYGMDGPISVFFNNKSLNSDGLNDGVIDATKGDEVWAFAGMRRGGKNYYALDISSPDKPKQLWSKPIVGGSDGFEYLAQTWSKPQIAYIKAFGDEPLLVFGGGYDTNKDNAIRSEDESGTGIYIVKAKTGERVWALTPEDNNFQGKHSIAADIATLDSDYDGYIDRLYATDTGGNIWRVDMPGSDKNSFSHYKLAELGSSLATQDRRFFYKPLVARTMFSKVSKTSYGGEEITTRLDTPYDAIVIGSGNRSNPLATNEQDHLYMIRDEQTVTKTFDSQNTPEPIVPSDLMLMNDDPFGNALDNVDEFVELETDLAGFKGWRYELSNGEKSLAAATVVGGVAYYTSFTPALESDKNQCSLTGGGGAMYAFHLHYGTKVYDQLKFTTSYDVPDTAQLYFGEGDSCIDANNNGLCDVPTPDDGDPDDGTPGGGYEYEETIPVSQVSQFYLIGPSLTGEGAVNPIKPPEINGPGLTVVDGKVKLVNDSDTLGFGFKTQQTYIYKREENDSSSD